MLRRTRVARVGFGRNHTAPTFPKYIDKPGVWGPAGGPHKDTLARRWEHSRLSISRKIGTLTQPFRTKKAVWLWRRLQARVWKTTVLCIMLFSVLMIGNIWIMMVYHAYNIGPSTPVLERKVREHRVSKQIVQMVREREQELVVSKEQTDAAAVLEMRKQQQQQRA
jgi:hypothetical protein